MWHHIALWLGGEFETPHSDATVSMAADELLTILLPTYTLKVLRVYRYVWMSFE